MTDATSRAPAIPTPLVDAATLHELIRGGHPSLRVVDLRWAAKGPSSLERYREAHVPTAVHVDLDEDLSHKNGPGRHPFPTTERFAALLGKLGIGPDTHVVVYDDGHGAIASRLWYMLRVHGHDRVSLLDGGMAAWRGANLPLAKGDENVAPVPTRQLRADDSRLLDRKAIRTLLLERRDGGPGKPLVMDARARPRYRGEFEPLDKRAGHIPGTVNAPYEEFVVSPQDPRFRPPAELRAAYERLGVPAASEVAVSCGSGVTACHHAIGLELAGFGLPKLYVGSFSEWASVDDEPVATGDAPGRLER